MLRAQKNQELGVRPGFTLIELMVVILIIGILFALVAAAVYGGLTKGKQTRNRVEISQLEEALEQFKQRFGAYPPSRILLSEIQAGYTGADPDGLKADSLAFLNKMFPRLNWSTVNTPITGGAKWQGVDWSGDTLQNAAITLEGDECLVFFLGGIPVPSQQSAGNGAHPGVLGFASNPANPADPTSTSRIGPFFEFDTNRLVALRASGPGHHYYSYLDNYGLSDGFGKLLAGVPYLYFSSYKSRNGYNRYFSVDNNSDCTTFGVWPYIQSGPAASAPSSPIMYLKPNSFQIISAGADVTFGPGTPPTGGVFWTPSTAAAMYPVSSPGHDDQSNFTGSLLGVGQD
jgi:general secretion pathway protein G